MGRYWVPNVLEWGEDESVIVNYVEWKLDCSDSDAVELRWQFFCVVNGGGGRRGEGR